MKKVFIALCIGFIFIFTINTNAAETSTNEQNLKLKKAGITPGSLFYGIDRFFEKVSYTLTFSDDKRVEKLADFSEERLAEINELDEEEDQEWLDNLFDDYGSDLNKANDILTRLISNEKTSDKKIEKMQKILEEVSTKEDLIKQKSKEKINEELKNRVQEIKVQVYLTVVSDKIKDNEKDKLKGYENGVIVKLYALSELTGLTIEEIMTLDIYEPDDPTTDIVEKNIDIDKLEKVLNIDKKEIIKQLKEYHKNKIEERKAEQEKKENQQGSEEKREEAKKRQEEIKKDMNERVRGGKQEVDEKDEVDEIDDVTEIPEEEKVDEIEVIDEDHIENNIDKGMND